jgi:hypothetical protein
MRAAAIHAQALLCAFPGEPLTVLGELLEGVEPDGQHEDAGPVDRLVHAHRFGVGAEAGRDLAGGLVVAAGQQEVLTLLPRSLVARLLPAGQVAAWCQVGWSPVN